MQSIMEIITLSERQTLNLGKKIAKQLKGGETIALIGELGAGKTILAKGIANGLGIKKTITSPSFVLMKVYNKTNNRKSKINLNEPRIQKLYHIDAYRLTSGKDLIGIGINDYLGQKNSITIIEWANQVRNILPKNTIFAKIKTKKKKNKRIITISKIKI